MPRVHGAHFTAIHVAQQARKEARAADHAYLTTPATRWQNGGNALDEPWWRVNQRAKAKADQVPASPKVDAAAAASSPPITSGESVSVGKSSGRSVSAGNVCDSLSRSRLATGPLTHTDAIATEDCRATVSTIQRPNPADCRTDRPSPAVPSVAAVGAPLYALVHYCRAAGLPEPVPEYRFHPTRMWRFDYAFPLHKIAVEVDGGVWTQGRHTRGAGYIADMEKMNAAAKLGWRVLKYTPQTLGVAIDDLRVVLT